MQCRECGRVDPSCHFVPLSMSFIDKDGHCKNANLCLDCDKVLEALRPLHPPRVSFLNLTAVYNIQQRFPRAGDYVNSHRNTDESKIMQELLNELMHLEADLIIPSCTNCCGTGWFQDSTEGGIWQKCHCWKNRVRELEMRMRKT